MNMQRKLKGRALQNGYTVIVSLSFSICAVVIFILNMIPLIFEKTLKVNSGYSPYIFSALSLLSFMLVIYFYSCFKLGIKRFFVKRALKSKAELKDIVYYFSVKRCFKSCAFVINQTIVKLVCFLFCFSPCLLIAILLLILGADSLSVAVAIALACGGALFFISGIVFLSELLSLFFLADYYFVLGEYLNLKHLYSCSIITMKNKKRELTKLKFSFFGWLVSCVFILPLFYVLCYYKQTLAVVACEYIKT